MTTIAGCPIEKIIVTDGSVSDDDQVWSVAKAERIAGNIYATAGGAADGERFYGWIRRGRRGKRPNVDESFYAMALTTEGLFLFDNELFPMRLESAHAIGSGSKAARGAMRAGASIRLAVQIACEIDAGSRPPIQVYQLDEKNSNE